MGKGLLGGMFFGAVISVGLAAAVSVLVPVHRPLQATVDAPQEAAEPAAVVAPETGEAQKPGVDAVVKVTQQPPVPLAPSEIVKAPENIQTAALPDVGAAEPLSDPVAAPQNPEADNSADAPVLVTPQAPAIVQNDESAPKADAEQTTAVRQPEIGSAGDLADPETQMPAGTLAAKADAPVVAGQPPATPQVAATDSDSPGVRQSTTPQPEIGVADILTAPEVLPAPTQTRIAQDAPVLPNPQALAPMEPSDAPAGPIQTDPAAPPVKVSEPAELPPAEDPAPATEPIAKPQDMQVATVRPRLGTPARSLLNRDDNGEGVRINRPASEQAPETSIAVVPPSVIVGAEESAPPIRRFALDFETPDNKPLMSIVLIDTGVNLEADEIGLPALRNFPYPLSFAVDFSLPDAAQRMARYRKEGFEVLALVDLPQGAQATDAEVTMSVALDRMSQVVAVLEGTGAGFQGSREASDQVTAILAQSGHGLVTQSQGLNTMPKLAVKAGVPAAPVFRDFDGKGQDARVIRRFLDQAAFKAGQEGGVIMLGRLQRETIQALLVWGLADRASQVTLAPVSAVLSR